ncbi:MAG: LAGLIDADG family homing endonuclease [Alphaproteobacteria bacterium]
MEGKGSIQVNQNSQKTRTQYRLVIKLKYTEANLKMLDLFAINIGGRVKKDKKNTVLWVVDNQIQIQEIIKIFDQYPPITTKMQLQLSFLNACLTGVFTVEHRDRKYADQKLIANTRNFLKFKEPDYFNI